MPYELRELAAGGNGLDERLWAEAAGESERGAPAGAGPFPAEARRLVALEDSRPVARLGCGVREGFSGAPGRTGYLGWYGTTDASAGGWLLREAALRLVGSGAERVVGPLDGSTWYRYRVALPREKEITNGSAFLAEPVNPPGWADQFTSAGFRPLLEYETRRVALPHPTTALSRKREELTDRGIRLRSLSLARYDSELRALHALSVEAFADNPFYTPIGLAEFERLYAPLRGTIDASLVRLAERDDGALMGYVFAFPDPLAVASAPRIVLKTLAVSRQVRGWGLGAVLVDEIHHAAAARGAAVLHALMQVTNASREISRRSESGLFRRYLLYEFVGG